IRLGLLRRERRDLAARVVGVGPRRRHVEIPLVELARPLAIDPRGLGRGPQVLGVAVGVKRGGELGRGIERIVGVGVGLRLLAVRVGLLALRALRGFVLLLVALGVGGLALGLSVRGFGVERLDELGEIAARLVGKRAV